MKLTIYVANKTFSTELAGRYRRPVVNKWELATCPDCQAIVWNAEAVRSRDTKLTQKVQHMLSARACKATT